MAGRSEAAGLFILFSLTVVRAGEGSMFGDQGQKQEGELVL